MSRIQADTIYVDYVRSNPDIDSISGNPFIDSVMSGYLSIDIIRSNPDIDSISGSKSQILRDHFEEKIEMTVLYEQNDSIKILTASDFKEAIAYPPAFLVSFPKSKLNGSFQTLIMFNFLSTNLSRDSTL